LSAKILKLVLQDQNKSFHLF